ncbi:uncharacterized protein AMSG_01599 [Thecamonas trahens ATCC 50062]|uniref:Uncharacterized protein n=1 Tax=Thecamonas trahens ATCC 50062 TaxID=461836 RepID=A0A0L0DTG5_THETB|nr:hypothetical protein AMSG_01599 [Thecamonas trahens ATCC 50062]KNC54748.1 hypothetical protein AMSG_01599 [Thecamonas trahens ATCC 50062]|eukprot:XP_013761648.1 hypothetical protein AMSG_01599 [Thecamonas trahens ATCC 50062]
MSGSDSDSDYALAAVAPTAGEVCLRLTAAAMLGYALVLILGVVIIEARGCVPRSPLPLSLPAALEPATLGVWSATKTRVCATPPCLAYPYMPHMVVMAVLYVVILACAHLATMALVGSVGGPDAPMAATVRVAGAALAAVAVLAAYVYTPFQIPAAESGTCVLAEMEVFQGWVRGALVVLGLVFVAVVTAVTDPLRRLGLAQIFESTRSLPGEEPPIVGRLLFPLLVGPALLLTVAPELTATRFSLLVAWLGFAVMAESFTYEAFTEVVHQVRLELAELCFV